MTLIAFLVKVQRYMGILFNVISVTLTSLFVKYQNCSHLSPSLLTLPLILTLVTLTSLFVKYQNCSCLSPSLLTLPLILTLVTLRSLFVKSHSYSHSFVSLSLLTSLILFPLISYFHVSLCQITATCTCTCIYTLILSSHSSHLLLSSHHTPLLIYPSLLLGS